MCRKDIILLLLSFAWRRDIIFLSCLESLTNIRIPRLTVLYHIVTITCPDLTDHALKNLMKKSYVAQGH